MNDAIKVFATRGSSLRKFVFPEPLKRNGHTWGFTANLAQIERDEANPLVRHYNNVYHQGDWIRDFAKAVVTIEGVYSFAHEECAEIEVTLCAGRRWFDMVTLKSGEQVKLKHAVQQVLIDQINKHNKTSYDMSSFPAKAELVNNLYAAR